MTPAIVEQAGAGQDGATPAVSNQALQLAFQQGADHAREQMADEQQTVTRQQRLEELEHLNQEQARVLRERTEELQKREYRCARWLFSWHAHISSRAMRELSHAASG